MKIVYTGCRTTKERGGHGTGIGVYRVLPDGSWDLLQTQPQLNPSYLCLDREEKFLYAIHGDQSQVSSYAIGSDGCLTRLGTVSSGGTNPVHLCVDRTNRWVFIANLQTGCVAVLPRLPDGSLGGPRHLYFIPGNGGPGYVSHPHQVCLSPDGQYLVVSAQGRLQGVGQAAVFRVCRDTGALELVHSLPARTGSEPRHCVFSPDGSRCYGVNEKSFTVTQYGFADGHLEARRIVQTLFEEQVEEGWASAIALHPGGKFLYTSDRRLNLICCFHLDPLSGAPVLLSQAPSQGRQPRFLGLSPDGRSLVAANELSDDIYEFPIDPDTGALTAPSLRARTGSPVCVVWSSH